MTEEINEQKNSFKLIKNSRGWNYEIKIYSNDLEEIKLKVEELNRWAKEKYG